MNMPLTRRNVMKHIRACKKIMDAMALPTKDRWLLMPPGCVRRMKKMIRTHATTLMVYGKRRTGEHP